LLAVGNLLVIEMIDMLGWFLGLVMR